MTDSKKRVDILLATYNGERYLKEQLNSLLSQTHKAIHIIAADDGSSDNTVELLLQYSRQFPDKITVVDSSVKTNKGVIGNFGRLLEKSSGSYCMFCDQDDVWNHDKVEVTLKKMLEIENLRGIDTPILIHTDLMVVDRDLAQMAPSFWRYANFDPLKTSCLNRLLAQNVVTGCTVMMNASLCSLAKPFPEGAVMHDWWVALVAASFGAVVPLKAPTMKYRQHGHNTLGAVKFLTLNQIWQWKHFGKKLEQRKIQQQKQINQAFALLERYKNRLTPHQQEMIKAYCQSVTSSPLKRLYLILKYRLFKNGFLRNLLNLFF
jgi:hypothetical protein